MFCHLAAKIQNPRGKRGSNNTPSSSEKLEGARIAQPVKIAAYAAPAPQGSQRRQDRPGSPVMIAPLLSAPTRALSQALGRAAV
jgi:hypothetical protein